MSDAQIWNPLIIINPEFILSDFSGQYLVSNQGEIKRIKNNRPLKPQKHKDGYVSVSLSKNNTTKGFFLHRVVASTFIPNPDKKPFVNHKNRIRDDNRVENLEWMTGKENNEHARTCKFPAPVKVKVEIPQQIHQLVFVHTLNWNDAYEIYSDGRIFGKAQSKFLQPVESNGYLYVSIYPEAKKIGIHRLVAQEFIPNPENKPVVNHLDRNPLNNDISNLEWTTYKENVQHALCKPVFKYSKQGELLEEFASIQDAAESSLMTECSISAATDAINTSGGFVWTSKPKIFTPEEIDRINNPIRGMALEVIQSDLKGNKIATFCSARDGAIKLGLDPSSVTKVCRGELKQTGGFRWNYTCQDEKPKQKVRSYLTVEQTKELREAYMTGTPAKDLAEKYGKSLSQIWRLART